MQSFNKSAKNIDISKQERHCCNQTMFKTYMQYCEAYCQKCSPNLRLSINCHKKWNTRLWQIYLRWWLTQDIIWFGIFHFQSINFLCTFVPYRRKIFWVVIIFLALMFIIGEKTCGRWLILWALLFMISGRTILGGDVWREYEAQLRWGFVAPPPLFLRLGEQPTLLLRKLHISCSL